MSLIMFSSLLAFTFSLFTPLFLKISACSLPKLIKNSHFCSSFERPINIEVTSFSLFCTNLISSRISVAIKWIFHMVNNIISSDFLFGSRLSWISVICYLSFLYLVYSKKKEGFFLWPALSMSKKSQIERKMASEEIKK